MSPTRRQVKATVDAALKEFGRIDILVNNAAFFNKKGVFDMPFDEWNKQTGVILGGAFLFTKHAAKAMLGQRRGGHQHHLDGGPSGRAGQHRLFDREGRPAQLHALGGDGAGGPRHPRQQPDADGDRSGRSPSNAPRAGDAR